MKLKIDEDGTLVGPHGRVYGRVTAIEIDWIEHSGALTPSEVRDAVECPFCNAEIGEFCHRWRGGDRKSNHAERVQFAVEELDSHEILSERSERYGNSAVSPSTDVSTSTENSFGEKELDRPTASQLQREAVVRVWDYWIEISGKKQKLDAKRERIIRNAVNLVGEDGTKLALLGLTRSPHHRGENEQRKKYMEIRYALRGIGDESDDERIEKAITWAAVHAPGQSLLSQAQVDRYLDDVRYTLSLPHKPERARAEDSYRKLVAAGFKLVQLDRAPWARLER